MANTASLIVLLSQLPRIHSIILINSLHALTLENILCISTTHITRRRIIAHGKVRRNIHPLQSLDATLFGTISSVAAHIRRALPDDLAEMAPVFEIRHVRVGVAVVGFGVRVHLAVVELERDYAGDACGWCAGGDVLTVGLGADGAVVREGVLAVVI